MNTFFDSFLNNLHSLQSEQEEDEEVGGNFSKLYEFVDYLISNLQRSTSKSISILNSNIINFLTQFLKFLISSSSSQSSILFNSSSSITSFHNESDQNHFLVELSNYLFLKFDEFYSNISDEFEEEDGEEEMGGSRGVSYEMDDFEEEENNVDQSQLATCEMKSLYQFFIMTLQIISSSVSDGSYQILYLMEDLSGDDEGHQQEDQDDQNPIESEAKNEMHTLLSPFLSSHLFQLLFWEKSNKFLDLKRLVLRSIVNLVIEYKMLTKVDNPSSDTPTNGQEEGDGEELIPLQSQQSSSSSNHKRKSNKQQQQIEELEFVEYLNETYLELKDINLPFFLFDLQPSIYPLLKQLVKKVSNFLFYLDCQFLSFSFWCYR